MGSKVRVPSDQAYIEEHSPGLPVLGYLPSAPEAQQADRAGQAAFDVAPTLVAAARVVAASLERELTRQPR